MVHVSHKRKITFENDKELYLHFIHFDMKNVESMWSSNNFALKHKLIPKLNIKDRVWKFKTHKRCFKGSNFVKAMKSVNAAMTILHAREIGTKLIELNYIEHVTHDQTRLWDHHQMWYRFT